MWGKRSSRERRRSGRKPTQWVGHYAIGTEQITTTAPCTIEGISRRGVGLVLYGGLDVRVGQTVAIDVERIGPTAVGFRVTGVVRHVGARDEVGGLRIGVQLSLDAPHEQQIAETLFA